MNPWSRIISYGATQRGKGRVGHASLINDRSQDECLCRELSLREIGECETSACRSFSSRSVNYVSSEVFVKRLRKTDRAIVLQSRLEQGDVEPCERCTGAVQCMAKVVLSVLSLEAQIHAAGLEIPAI